MRSVMITRENYDKNTGEFVLELKKKYYIPEVIEVIVNPKKNINHDDLDIINDFLKTFTIKRKFDVASIFSNVKFKEYLCVTLPEEELLHVNWGVSVKITNALSSYQTTFIGGSMKINNEQLHPYYESIVVFSPYSWHSPLSKIPLKEKHVKFFTKSFKNYPSKFGRDYNSTIEKIVDAFINNMLFSTMRITQEKGIVETQLFDGKKLYHSDVWSEEEFGTGVENRLIEFLENINTL